MDIYIHTYIHTYMHAYIHTYIQTHTHRHACMHACIHTYIRSFIRSFIHAFIHSFHTIPYHYIVLHCITLHYNTLHIHIIHGYSVLFVVCQPLSGCGLTISPARSCLASRLEKLVGLWSNSCAMFRGVPKSRGGWWKHFHGSSIHLHNLHA